MQSFLRGRPTHFNSVEHAIEWCVRSGQVRNVDSAKVPMPRQIVNCETGELATREVESYQPEEVRQPAPTRHEPLPDRIGEESEATFDPPGDCGPPLAMRSPELSPGLLCGTALRSPRRAVA